ncbi:MAG: hypothetical protein QM576_09095 [Rhodopseudomonas sp.]|uniref:hypothetical protein n=1 Tax=Rhodopseudomonas sp. TaxID=1078 RepID=UPI0039E61347
MNALLKSILSFTWTHDAVKPAKDFPPEAYSYDDPIDPAVIARIQAEADKVLDKQQWTVIERLGDGHTR